MRGIVSAAGYLPFRRLQRADITATFGTGGGKGTRTVASYDEDTTTLGVEAARLALRAAARAEAQVLLLSTVAPAYLDKTNATAVHAALRLDEEIPALDLNGSVRSAVGAIGLALNSTASALVVSADVRTGLPGSADEAGNGDAAAALFVGSDADGTVIAEHIGAASTTEKFVARWRTPGDIGAKVWEERFGETKYVPLGEHAWKRALESAGLAATDVTRVIIAGSHARAARSLAGKLGAAKDALVDDLGATVGFTGAAHPALLLASALEQSKS